MDDPSQVRRAAREAVGETTPDRLRTNLFETLDTGSMVPGVLTLLSVRAANEGRELDEQPNRERGATDGSEPSDTTAVDDALARRAAGVQLIYDGLRVTRTLAHEEPWTDASRDRTEADIAILAADVLVARGFYLLARTECAARAVETVRRFGRDQTRRDDSNLDGDEETSNRNLEADALDLAMRCGVTATGAEVPQELPSFAAALATTVDGGGFLPAEEFLSSSVTDDLTVLLGGHERRGVSGGVSPTTDG